MIDLRRSQPNFPPDSREINCDHVPNLAPAESKKPGELHPWCVNLPASAKIDYLQCLRSTVETLTLRQIFTDVSDGKRVPPPLNPSGEIKTKELLKLFQRPILVFKISEAHQGGHEVSFIFKKFPQHEFLAWFAFTDDGSYKLQIVGDMGPMKESAKIRRRLQKREFQPYWL